MLTEEVFRMNGKSAGRLFIVCNEPREKTQAFVKENTDGPVVAIVTLSI